MKCDMSGPESTQCFSLVSRVVQHFCYDYDIDISKLLNIEHNMYWDEKHSTSAQYCGCPLSVFERYEIDSNITLIQMKDETNGLQFQ